MNSGKWPFLVYITLCSIYGLYLYVFYKVINVF